MADDTRRHSTYQFSMSARSGSSMQHEVREPSRGLPRTGWSADIFYEDALREMLLMNGDGQ